MYKFTICVIRKRLHYKYIKDTSNNANNSYIHFLVIFCVIWTITLLTNKQVQNNFFHIFGPWPVLIITRKRTLLLLLKNKAFLCRIARSLFNNSAISCELKSSVAFEPTLWNYVKCIKVIKGGFTQNHFSADLSLRPDSFNVCNGCR